VDNKGVIRLRVKDSITIGQLYRIGVKQIKLEPKTKPLRNGWLTPED